MTTTNRVPCRQTEEAHKRTHHDAGATDAKGRAVGHRIDTFQETWEQIERDGPGYICEPERLGLWFCYRLHSTRDGQPFGASPKTMSYRTADERDDAAAKALRAAQRRAAKKFA